MPPATRATRIDIEQLRSVLALPGFHREAWLSALGEHPHIRIGNADAAVGRENALAALERLLGSIDGFGDRFFEFWQWRETIVIETDIRCPRRGAQQRSIPCAIIARTTFGRIQDLRFHFDPTPIIWPQDG